MFVPVSKEPSQDEPTHVRNFFKSFLVASIDEARADAFFSLWICFLGSKNEIFHFPLLIQLLCVLLKTCSFDGFVV